MLLGIIGMSLITLTNIYFDQQKEGNIDIGRKSQSISRQILKTMMLEEHYIASGKEDILESIVSGAKGYRKEPGRY